MPKDEQQQIFNFILNVVSVKMKVKFPCKMVIEQGAQPLTSEVPPTEDGKFTFNQQIRLREEGDKLFSDLSITLVTDKGARYISGMAKLYHNELVRAEGERLVVSLSKCLDSQAFCELRVDKIIREGGRRRTLTTLPERNQQIVVPKNADEVNYQHADFRSPKKNEPMYIGFDAKSDSHFPVTTNLRLRRQQDDGKGRDHGAMAGQFALTKKANNSPKGRTRPLNSKNKYFPMEYHHAELQRDKMLQAEVYKDNYQKLKQKYLRESENSKNELNKRMMLQNNENNFKLEIVRLKLRNEQLGNELMEKNARLKDLSMTLSSLQGLQSEINIVREDLHNKEHAISIMDDTIISLSKENDELRSHTKEITYHLEEKIISLQAEFQKITTSAAQKQEELERQLKHMKEQYQHKENELGRKNDLLDKQKKQVYDLERSIQNKLFQFDSILQNERAGSKQKIDEIKAKLEEAQQHINKASNEKNDLAIEIDRCKGIILKNQYQFKLYQQDSNALRIQIEELKEVRNKYNELLKELRSISEQKIIIEKNHERVVISKEQTLEEMTYSFKKQIDHYKKTSRQFEEKNKLITSKLIEAESQLQLTKGSYEKNKKNQQNLTKQYSELKEKEKQLKKSLKVKEQQCDDVKKELLRLKEKNQALLQTTKLDFTKVRQELAKTKIELQSEMVKNEQLVETNSDINMELARMKMSMQFSEEKYEKMTQSAQEKYEQYQKIIHQHESVIELLEQKIRKQKENEKDCFSKLQKCDYQINVVVEKNDKIIKQIKVLQEKNRQLEHIVKIKQLQFVDILKKISDLQSKLCVSEERASELKDYLQVSNNQLEKSKKIIEIVQKDYDKAKSDIISYCQKLNEREKEADDQIYESRKDKEKIAQFESRYNSLKKQYQKFKETVSDALNNSFIQVIQSFSTQKNDQVRNSVHGTTDMQSLAMRRGLNDLSSDLVNAINTAGRQNKNQITKQNEKIRSLQKDLTMLKGQMDRTQESYKKQIYEKNYYTEQLSQELRTLREEQGETVKSNNMHTQQLEEQIRNYQEEFRRTLSTKSQLQFSLNNLHSQLERITEESQKQYRQFKKQKQQLQQKLQYQSHSTQILEKKNHEMQVELMNLNAIVVEEKQLSYKKSIQYQELLQEKQKIVHQFGGTKRKLKELQEKYSELEIQYITINEIKLKYESMLSSEQIKLKDVRAFNNHILKEKQDIIRKDLEKSMLIANLEDSISQLKQSLQQQEEIKQKYKADLDQLRDHSKRFTGQNKDMENAISKQRQKYKEIVDRLREKEQQLTELKQQNNFSKKKLNENQTKSQHLIDELKEQNNMLSKQIEIITSQSGENNRTLQTQLAQLTQQVHAIKQENAQLQQALFVQRQNNNSMQDSINLIKNEVDESRKKIEQLEKAHQELLEQNRFKDEQMYEIAGKLYEYENRIRECQEEKQREIQQLNNNFSAKYDEDCQQMYQKLQFIEKQKDYFKEKYNEKQLETTKKNEEIKHKQIQWAQIKRCLQEKVKKLEEQKLGIFSDKNKEIAKIMDENKAQFDSIRSKQSELRKVIHQLQISRSSIQKLQSKIKQMQSDRNTQIKAYQTQIEGLRKKELICKSYKDTVRSNQWNCERQVRKIIQNFIKRLLESGEKEVRSQTMISSIKTMEQSLLIAISIIAQEGP